MQSGDFEWDDDKAAANVAKHGVLFEVARRIFDDLHWCELAIDTHAGETRFNDLGMVNGGGSARDHCGRRRRPRPDNIYAQGDTK